MDAVVKLLQNVIALLSKDDVTNRSRTYSRIIEFQLFNMGASTELLGIARGLHSGKTS